MLGRLLRRLARAGFFISGGDEPSAIFDAKTTFTFFLFRCHKTEPPENETQISDPSLLSLTIYFFPRSFNKGQCFTIALGIPAPFRREFPSKKCLRPETGPLDRRHCEAPTATPQGGATAADEWGRIKLPLARRPRPLGD